MLAPTMHSLLIALIYTTIVYCRKDKRCKFSAPEGEVKGLRKEVEMAGEG